MSEASMRKEDADYVFGVSDALKAWRSIDSAPRDGSHIIVWDGWPQPGWWDDEDACNGGQCWKRSEDHSPLTPTHWMPLTEPPRL